MDCIHHFEPSCCPYCSLLMLEKEISSMKLTLIIEGTLGDFTCGFEEYPQIEKGKGRYRVSAIRDAVDKFHNHWADESNDGFVSIEQFRAQKRNLNADK